MYVIYDKDCVVILPNFGNSLDAANMRQKLYMQNRVYQDIQAGKAVVFLEDIVGPPNKLFYTRVDIPLDHQEQLHGVWKPTGETPNDTREQVLRFCQTLLGIRGPDQGGSDGEQGGKNIGPTSLRGGPLRPL